MAKKNGGVNKSEEVRKLLKANPAVKANEVVSTLAGKGITIKPNLYYFVKGQMKGRKGGKKKAQRIVAQVAESTQVSRSDALSTILKVKSWANEVGGMKSLKALVEALSE
jgi:hypothetical protein